MNKYGTSTQWRTMELNKGMRIVSIDGYNLQDILFGLRMTDKYLHILKISGIINK